MLWKKFKSMRKYYFILLIGIFISTQLKAQISEVENVVNQKDSIQDERNVMSKAIPELKYIKQPGLANAASKIYSADQRFSISGFGEINYVNYRGMQNRSSQDIELYYTNLYRSGTYIGYKITDKIIFNSELQLELLHDGFREYSTEANLELILDILFSPYINLRVGNYPVPVGYVNINEEPIAFYTVNRPEVERILLPTQWLETGAMLYGNFLKVFEYNAGLTKGLNSTDFLEGSWIRRGRFHGLGAAGSWAANGKIEYVGSKATLLGISGYTGNAANAELNADGLPLETHLSLVSGFAGYTWKSFSAFGLFTRGWLSGTEQLHALNGRVIGAATLGYYTEIRWDIWKDLGLGKKGDFKLPIFIRYERLNTHDQIHPSLSALSRDENDLEIISIGANVRPKKNWVFKANYQFRSNRYQKANIPEANRMELGMGFIF